MSDLAGLITAIGGVLIGLLTALGVRYRDRRSAARDAERQEADTDLVRAEAAGKKAAAASAAVATFERALAAMHKRQTETETEMTTLRLQLLDATGAVNRYQRETEGLRQQYEIARELAALEIARLRAQLEAGEAECREEITLIRAELEARAHAADDDTDAV